MEYSDFTNKLKASARLAKRSLALPESHDPRVLAAALLLLEVEAARFIQLFGEQKQILTIAKNNNIALAPYASSLRWAQPSDQNLREQTLLHFQRRAIQQGKTLSSTETQTIPFSPLSQAAMLLATDQVDAVVAGSEATTAEVIRAALRGVGLAAESKTISGSFAMIRELPQNEPQYYMFADCAVVIDPSIDQLQDIAVGTVASFQALFPELEPKLAFLSFSTYASAKHPSQQKIAEAAQLFAAKFPSIICDGELQFDAAMTPSISQRKSPSSRVQGQANCFVFPNLDAGNIAYKITQRLGGFAAYGPILQGIAKPFNDLSRGASVNDIAIAGLISMLRAQPKL